MLTKVNKVHEMYLTKMLKTIRNIDGPLDTETNHKIIGIFKSDIEALERSTEILDQYLDDHRFTYSPFVGQIMKIKNQLKLFWQYFIDSFVTSSKSYLDGVVMTNLRQEYQKLKAILTNCHRMIDIGALKRMKCAMLFDRVLMI